MTYEQRRRILAEKMAIKLDGQLWEYQPEMFKEKAIQAMLPLADISLADSAEMYKTAHRQGWFDHIDSIVGDKPQTVEQHIHSLGLTE